MMIEKNLKREATLIIAVVGISCGLLSADRYWFGPEDSFSIVHEDGTTYAILTDLGCEVANDELLCSYYAAFPPSDDVVKVEVAYRDGRSVFLRTISLGWQRDDSSVPDYFWTKGGLNAQLVPAELEQGSSGSSVLEYHEGSRTMAIDYEWTVVETDTSVTNSEGETERNCVLLRYEPDKFTEQESGEIHLDYVPSSLDVGFCNSTGFFWAEATGKRGSSYLLHRAE